MFGERIGEYLTENQIDRSLLAQQIGVSVAELEGMLSGARVLPAEVYFLSAAHCIWMWSTSPDEPGILQRWKKIKIRFRDENMGGKD